jgi:hypothetical protein
MTGTDSGMTVRSVRVMRVGQLPVIVLDGTELLAEPLLQIVSFGLSLPDTDGSHSGKGHSHDDSGPYQGQIRERGPPVRRERACDSAPGPDEEEQPRGSEPADGKNDHGPVSADGPAQLRSALRQVSHRA